MHYAVNLWYVATCKVLSGLLPGGGLTRPPPRPLFISLTFDTFLENPWTIL